MIRRVYTLGRFLCHKGVTPVMVRYCTLRPADLGHNANAALAIPAGAGFLTDRFAGAAPGAAPPCEHDCHDKTGANDETGAAISAIVKIIEEQKKLESHQRSTGASGRYPTGQYGLCV